MRTKPQGIETEAEIVATSDAPRSSRMCVMHTTLHSTKRTQYARSLCAVALIAIAMPAAAQVAVTEPWVRGTVTGQKATGAFMQIKSPTDTSLVGVSSPVAKIVEVHSMKMEGGVMKMNAVSKVAVPAGQALELKPGGYHVMLVDLVAPLKDGDTVPLKLTFEDKAGKKETVDVKAVVRPLAAGAPHTMK